MDYFFSRNDPYMALQKVFFFYNPKSKMATIARQTKFLHRTIWENGEKNSPRNQEVEPKCYMNDHWMVPFKIDFFLCQLEIHDGTINIEPYGEIC
jgi:hypothetical protein